MGKRGHSEEEILRVLREAESGDTVVEVCRKHGISQQRFYLWKKKYAGLGLQRASRTAATARGEREAEALGSGPQPGPAHPSGDRRKKAVRPRVRRELAEWAQQAHQLSQRRAARLIPVEPDDPALRAPSRSAGGLARALARVGRQPRALWLSTADGAAQARGLGGERQAHLPALHRRRTDRAHPEAQENERNGNALPLGQAARPNHKWSMDFVAQRLPDGRWIRVLTVVDQFTRECLTLFADTALSGEKVAIGSGQGRRSAQGPCSRSPLTTELSLPAKPWICGLTRTACIWTSSGQASRSRTVISKASTASCGMSA